MTTKFALALAVLLGSTALTAPPRAEASLAGDTVTCLALPVLSCNVPSTQVVPGPEFVISDPSSAPRLVVDFFDVGILRLFNPVGPFTFAGDTLFFGDLDWIVPTFVLVGIQPLASGGVSNFDITNVQFGPDSLTVQMAGSTWQQGGTFDLLLLFAPPGGGTGGGGGTVPEPSTLALLSLAMVSMFVLRLKRALA